MLCKSATGSGCSSGGGGEVAGGAVMTGFCAVRIRGMLLLKMFISPRTARWINKAKTTMNMMNSSTPRVLNVRDSWRVSGLRMSFGSISPSVPAFFGLDYAINHRVMPWDQGMRLQVHQERIHPQPANTHGRCNQHPRKTETPFGVREVRNNQPVQINPAHHDHPNRQHDDLGGVTLDTLGKQQEKRHKKVQQNQRQAYPPPAARSEEHTSEL